MDTQIQGSNSYTIVISSILPAQIEDLKSNICYLIDSQFKYIQTKSGTSTMCFLRNTINLMFPFCSLSSFIMYICVTLLLLFVIQRLELYGIPVPRYALVNRDVPYEELDFFVEEEDFVEVHGNRFWKPFVEKPVDGELLDSHEAHDFPFWCYFF